MTLEHALLVSGSAAVAGVMNAIAGGGTLLTFPSLLLAGLSPVSANVTSTVALWPGQLSSVWAYRRHIGEERPRALVLAVPSLLGGTIGAVLLLALPESAFEAVVPWLILFACLLLAIQGPVKRLVARHAAGSHPVVHWFLQLAISIYGGYFGAGIGILMLAAMGILIPSTLQHANALKVLFALLTNTAAVVLFLALGPVRFEVAGIMLVASIAGGYAGAHLAQRLSPAVMRAFAIAVGLFAAGRLLLA